MVLQLFLSRYLRLLFFRNWPLFVVLVITLLLDFLNFFGLGPSFNELIGSIADSAHSVSYIAIVIFSILEHLVFIGVYAPFSVVILVIMASTAGDPTRAFLVFLAILLGQIIAYSANILLGSRITNKVAHSRRISFLELWLSCSHPQLGAAATFSLGSSNQKYLTAVAQSVFAVTPWSVFWALVAYHGLTQIIDDIGWSTIFYGYVSVVLLVDIFRLSRRM